MTASISGPVQASERIQTLDIVRGFALLGILWRRGTYGRPAAPVAAASIG
jgi:uncharacterized membrane protein YeiB